MHDVLCTETNVGTRISHDHCVFSQSFYAKLCVQEKLCKNLLFVYFANFLFFNALDVLIIKQFLFRKKYLYDKIINMLEGYV